MTILLFLKLITILAIAGCGLMSGLFFVFSVSVMRALALLPAAEGIRAMQSINRTILNGVFLSTFFGTEVACLAVTVISLWQRQPGWAWGTAGAACYLVGGFLITAACNVPLNNQLDPLSATAPESEAQWQRYLHRWTRWNHLRTLASTTAVILLSISLLSR
ncbi:hypothetical protein Poly24_40280 [Rosistilla carotiformis]|uniref:DUF1772 domain-containing protein n=1 Tax=Rosistilla carotiformis TaxID=2528017 RepID=A0A518JXN6_9BACT|nr:anthrone oxygenase family protein [Rosistilla carotiformis]QDV70307.1 hypothetical protein Poly24_40280 [Rosistilla carotiformis]